MKKFQHEPTGKIESDRIWKMWGTPRLEAILQYFWVLCPIVNLAALLFLSALYPLLVHLAAEVLLLSLTQT